MLRADRETASSLGMPTRTKLLRLVEQTVDDYQIVIISDYAKGLSVTVSPQPSLPWHARPESRSW